MNLPKGALSFIFTERFGWSALITVLIGVVIGATVTVGSFVAIEETSTNEFCGTCHSHIPIINAYKDDIHGGNNSNGISAKCVDCHLPHDSIPHYLLEKTKAGVRDLVLEFLTDTTKTDWMAIREHHEDFVFDSGCIQCHTNLKTATSSNLKALIAHKEYYAEKSELKCVSCHKHVGHKNLGKHLKKTEYKWSTENYLSNQ